MNLLTEGIAKGLVVETGTAKKMTIDGITQTYPVYKVRLDCLYYNDRNDRIATWISKYKAENGVSDFNKDNVELYNNVIQSFIEQSNQDAINRTQNNIKLVGQREPGVVLSDGRVVDGNRRFTCLRKLSNEDTQNYNYFETVILTQSLEHNEKQIKMLELQIQMGYESRVDYNPIDRLVGVYQDVVKNKLLSVKEYAQSTNKTSAEVEKDIELAKLMVEYLEFINAPGQFYIARESDLNGPLVELQGILKNARDDEYKDQIKAVVFANLLVQPDGDMTRYVRNIKPLVKDPETKYLDEFIKKSIEIADGVVGNLPPEGSVTPETIASVRKNVDVKNNLRQIAEISTNKEKAKQTKNLPLQNLTKALDNVRAVDLGLFVKLDESQKEELLEKIDEITSKCEQIKEMLHVS